MTMNIFNHGLLSKIWFGLLITACVGLFNTSANSQTVLVNYDFNATVAGTPCAATPNNIATGVTAVFTTSTGTCTAPGGNATTGTAFTQNATAGNAASITGFAVSSTQYFQVQLNNVATFGSYAVYFQAFRSGTGAQNATLQYSTDGTNFADFQTVIVPNNVNTPVFGAYNFDLSTTPASPALNNKATVYFRILGSNGTGGNGTFRIDNFQVQAIGPTASAAEVSGRVIDNENRGLSRVYVTLSGGSMRSTTVLTNGFGYYSFPEVPVGQTYVVSVSSKIYTFNQPTLVFTVNENLADINFIGYR